MNLLGTRFEVFHDRIARVLPRLHVDQFAQRQLDLLDIHEVASRKGPELARQLTQKIASVIVIVVFPLGVAAELINGSWEDMAITKRLALETETPCIDCLHPSILTASIRSAQRICASAAWPATRNGNALATP